jgi:hypothetical protein
MAEKSTTEPPKKRRGPGRPFQKGSCPNPGGRPKAIAKVLEFARANGEQAVRVLVEVMNDKSEEGRTRATAANMLLDRAYGKPAQAITDGEGKPVRPGIIVLPMEVVE